MAREYTQETVARALDVHRHHGRIRNCYIQPGSAFVVELNNGGTYKLRTLREAYVFVLALASAGQAPARVES